MYLYVLSEDFNLLILRIRCFGYENKNPNSGFIRNLDKKILINNIKFGQNIVALLYENNYLNKNQQESQFTKLIVNVAKNYKLKSNMLK